MYMHNKKEWNNTRKSLLRLFFMSLVLVCICTLAVPKKSLAQETTDSATYAGSTMATYLVGASVLIYGIFQIVAGVKKFKDSKGKAILAIVCGVLSIIVSIIAFTHPVLTMFSVGYMIAFAVLMQGINMIVLAVNFGKEGE